MVNVARPKVGEFISIHAVAGAVGQAAFIPAQYLDAVVHAVVHAVCGS